MRTLKLTELLHLQSEWNEDNFGRMDNVHHPDMDDKGVYVHILLAPYGRRPSFDTLARILLIVQRPALKGTKIKYSLDWA